MAARRSGRAAETVPRAKPRTTGAPVRPRAFQQVHALAALEAALDAVIAIDHRGSVLEFNPAAERLFGFGRAEAVGSTLAELIVPPAAREAHRAGLARWTDDGPGPGAGSLLGRRIEVTAQNAAGEELPIELAITRLDVDGPPIFTASIRDLRDRHSAAERLRSVEERFRTLVEQLPLAVYIDAIDAGSSNLYSSPQIEPMLGYTTAEWLEEPDLFVRLLHPDDRERVLGAHARAHEVGALSLEYRLVARDGRIVWVQDEARTVLGPSGAEALQGYLLDVTERKAAEELLRHRAHHDELTDLPNRRLFGERVDAAIGTSRRKVAVMIVDLDDFKAVNDRLGHVDGDAVLLKAGSRLRDAVPDALTLARLGGDEFAVLVDTAAPEDDAVAVAEAVIEALREPAAVDDMEVSVTASVGIAAGDDADLLFRHADLAVYRAKAGGKAQFELYDASMDKALSGRLALVGELRRAQIEKDFVLHYQPVVGLETGEITGVEALVRWLNPSRGLVSPEEFVPIAEESGVIVPLGRWVLREACAQLARWRKAVNGAAGLKVSVNVSARQLQSGRFVQDVVEALEASKLEPGGLVLEITEATVVHDPRVAAHLLGQLREMGVGLMLDDFGTGYSSLSVLDSLPFDGLKLDRTSVTRLEPAGGGVRMVRAIVDLGRTLGLSLVAEGIEGEYQLAELKRLGVLHGQGFLFARPLEPGDLADLLRARAISGRTAAA